MAKSFKCEKCLREFSRKQHLIQHYNRKIPCVNTPNQVIYVNEPGNILLHTITSGNISVFKNLPTEQMKDGKSSEPISEMKQEPESEPKVEITPNLQQEIAQPNLSPRAKEYHNKSIKVKKIRSELIMKALENTSVYSELFKRVKKYFQSQQVKLWLEEENLPDPINPNITLDELRGWYKDFKTEIEIEYQKIKILD